MAEEFYFEEETINSKTLNKLYFAIIIVFIVIFSFITGVGFGYYDIKKCDIIAPSPIATYTKTPSNSKIHMFISQARTPLPTREPAPRRTATSTNISYPSSTPTNSMIEV